VNQFQSLLDQLQTYPSLRGIRSLQLPFAVRKQSVSHWEEATGAEIANPSDQVDSGPEYANEGIGVRNSSD